MKQQKCPNCKKWNENATRCVYCDTALVAEELNKEYKAKIDQEDAAKKDGKVLTYFQGMKSSRFLFVRMCYQILFAVWSVYMFIVAIFTWIIATTVG